MNPFKTSMYTGLLAVLAAVLLWGAMPFVIEIASREVPAGQLVAVRLLLAGIVLGLVLGPRRLLSAIRANLRLFVVLALLGFTVPHLFYIYALQSLPIATLTFITNSYPALAVLLAVFFLAEKPSVSHWAGMGVAVVGLFLLAGDARRLSPAAAVGVICALVASLGWAAAAVVGKRLTVSLQPLEIVAGRHLVAGLCALPLLPFEGVRWQGISTAAWVSVLALAAISVFSFTLYYHGLTRTSVATASMIEALTPVVTLGLSIALTGQSLEGIRWVGAGLVLGGTLLVTAHTVRQARTASSNLDGPAAARLSPKST